MDRPTQLRRKAEGLTALSAELDALAARAHDLLNEADDPREGVLLNQLADVRRALGDYLPHARDAGAGYEERRQLSENYIKRTYGRPVQEATKR